VKKVDEFFFAVLRMVTVMIHVDGPSDAEKRWFKHIMKAYPLTDEQTKQLLADLERSPDFDELKYYIRYADDRRKLIQLTSIAMKVDGKIDPREQELLERLKALENEPTNFVAEYAKELEKQYERTEMWELIEGLGQAANERVHE
jgi:uncharacterized tellurite resistance protein B-like protein